MMKTTKTPIFAALALAAAIAAGLFACMPVSGLFGLGLRKPSGTAQAASAGSYALAAELNNATSVAVYGDTAYYTLNRYSGADYYDLHSMPLSQGSSGTLLDNTNQQSFVHLLVLPPSGSNGLEILGIHMDYGTGYSYVRYAPDGTITASGSLPAQVAQNLGSYQTRGAAAGPDGSVYLFNAYSNGCPIVKLDRNLTFQWAFDPVEGNAALASGFADARSAALTQAGDLAYSINAASNSSGSADVRGGCVYILDAATGALKSSHMGAYLLSDPTVIACGSEGNLYAYNFKRNALQAYDPAFTPLYYAANAEWLGEDSGAGDKAVKFILPGANGLRVIAGGYSGYSLYSFTAP